MIFNNMSEGTSVDAKSTSSHLHDSGESELRRGPWTLEEDNLLIQYISCHGEGRWNSSAKCAGLKRTGKSCRLRWLNYLKPDIKRGNLTPHEQLLILELHSKWGNRWSRIAQHLPGRTDNEIKNYWRTRVQKQARQLKVDSNSKKFLEAIRTFWIPRLMEKMDQQNQDSPSPTSSSPSYNSSTSTQFAAAAPSSPVICKQAPLPGTSVAINQDSDSKNGSISQHLVPDCILPGFSSCGEIQCEDSFDDHHYYVGISPSTYGMQEDDIPISGSHLAEANWFGDDSGSCFWNTDELWQFRKSGEIGV